MSDFVAEGKETNVSKSFQTPYSAASGKQDKSKLLHQHLDYLDSNLNGSIPMEEGYARIQRRLMDDISYMERLAEREMQNGNVITIPVGRSDIDVIEMARFFANQVSHPTDTDCTLAGFSYDYEVYHTTRWFAGQVAASGSIYGRTQQNHSSRKTYNSFRNPHSLMWIAHILGEKDEVIMEASEAARAAGTNLSSKCAAVRRIIPFDRIYELYMQIKENT